MRNNIKIIHKRNFNLSVELERDPSSNNLHEDYQVNIYPGKKAMKVLDKNKKRAKIFKAKHSHETQRGKFHRGIFENRLNALKNSRNSVGEKNYVVNNQFIQNKNISFLRSVPKKIFTLKRDGSEEVYWKNQDFQNVV